MVSDEDLSQLKKWLLANDIAFKEKVEIARLSQIKAGGIFNLMVMPSMKAQVTLLVKELSTRSLPYKVIGNLSNILFRDGEIRTVAISMRGLQTLNFENDGSVLVEAGVMLPTLARKLVKSGHKGFAGLIGVPASVGGAVMMNASCYGDAISDYLFEVSCITPSGDIKVFTKADLKFSWRHSVFHNEYRGYLIYSVKLRPAAGDLRAEIAREQSIKKHRKTYQEDSYPNLGSTFATRDIYREIANRFPLYRAGLLVVKILARLLPGEVHHLFASLARGFTRTYFHIKRGRQIDFSASTFNCVVNLGGAKADELIEFVSKTHQAIDFCVPLEIELLKDIE